MSLAIEALQRSRPDYYDAFSFLTKNRQRLPQARIIAFLDGLFQAALSVEGPLYDELLLRIVSYVRDEDEERARATFGALTAQRRSGRVAQSQGTSDTNRLEKAWEPLPYVQRAIEAAGSNPVDVMSMLNAMRTPERPANLCADRWTHTARHAS